MKVKQISFSFNSHSSDLFYPSHYTIQRCEVPVFGFTFQQPVDDIRNFCYVWVMYGNKSAECIITHLELYQLLYEKRDAVDNFGYVYDVSYGSGTTGTKEL